MAGGIPVHVVEYTRRASAAQLCSGCGASGRWAIGYCRGRCIRGNLAVVFGVGFAFEARAVSPRFSGVAAKAAWRPFAWSGIDATVDVHRTVSCIDRST